MATLNDSNLQVDTREGYVRDLYSTDRVGKGGWGGERLFLGESRPTLSKHFCEWVFEKRPPVSPCSSVCNV